MKNERFNEIEKIKMFILGILTGNKEDIIDMDIWYKKNYQIQLIKLLVMILNFIIL